MPKLLVSVRDPAEAQIALAGGADLIDVKEPTRGPLGAADDATVRAIVARVAGRAPLSVALGELDGSARLSASLAGRVSYAKFGLAGCRPSSDWAHRWQAAIGELPPRVTPVAVAYADWQAADAPEPAVVLSHAADFGCGAVLLDTFDKTQGPLVVHLSLAAIEQFLAAARAARLVSVVAGGLGCQEIGQIMPLRPDYFGVRGAACLGRRTGRLDRSCVRQLSTWIQRGTHADASPTRAARIASG